MGHRAGPHHVPANVRQTAMQVLVGVNGCGVVAILPERSLAILALVVLLSCTAGDELHTLRYNVCPRVFSPEDGRGWT